MLEKMFSPQDLKSLSGPELKDLCADLRKAILESVSRNGGHLASNLGAVEMTVAIHRVYDTSRDRLVFDVGHQCYAHKLLTGRQKEFQNLRHIGGVSGFPKPYESEHDAFVAGHASNSVSVALGMARARSALKKDYDVVCVIGDGALSGGLAMEGLSDAGSSGEALVVVLNDNAMSINHSRGGVSRMLGVLRVRPSYLKLKRWYRSFLPEKVPGFYGWLHSVKVWIKQRVIPDNIFDDYGFEYFGPIDGHNLAQVENTLRYAKAERKPCLVHVITEKGHGYAPAVEHPEIFHGVGPFDLEIGIVEKNGKDFSAVFGDELLKLAGKDDSIVAITAAMTGGTGLNAFAEKYPKRFFDVGIAEEHACAMAAGMASQGLKPVFAVYSTFLQRAYDMLIHDVSLQNLHVVFCVDRAGIVGRDGETHQGAFDVSYLSSVPRMTVLSPASFSELRSMLNRALYEMDGPVAIRYPRGGEGLYKANSSSEDSICLRDGKNITLVSYGTEINELIQAADLLENRGISAEIIKLNTIKPFKAVNVLKSVAKTDALLVCEECCESGCVGMEILSAAAAEKILVSKVKLLNLGDGIVQHGSPEELKHKEKLDAESIAEEAERLLNG